MLEAEGLPTTRLFTPFHADRSQAMQLWTSTAGDSPEMVAREAREARNLAELRAASMGGELASLAAGIDRHRGGGDMEAMVQRHRAELQATQDELAAVEMQMRKSEGDARRAVAMARQEAIMAREEADEAREREAVWSLTTNPHLSPLTPHVSRLTSHVSRVSSHVSRLTSHVSRLTSYLSSRSSHLSALTSHAH